MMKLLIKTNSPACYIDPNTGNEVQPFRPSVVETSQYITQLLGDHRVELISNKVSDEASDDEFNKFFIESERDEDLAVSAFLSKFGSNEKPEKAADKHEAAAAKKEADEKAAAAAKKEADEKEAAAKAAADKKEAESKKD